MHVCRRAASSHLLMHAVCVKVNGCSRVYMYVCMHVYGICVFVWVSCMLYIYPLCCRAASSLVCLQCYTLRVSLHVSVDVYLCFVCVRDYLYAFMQMHAYRVVCLNIERIIDLYRIYVYIYMHIHIHVYYLNSHLLLAVFPKKPTHEYT